MSTQLLMISKTGEAKLPLHGLAGYVTCTRRELEAVFGQPEDYRGLPDTDGKITTHWTLHFIDWSDPTRMIFATIYDWKQYEAGAPTMDQVFEWNIGGNLRGVQAVEEVLGARVWTV